MKRIVKIGEERTGYVVNAFWVYNLVKFSFVNNTVSRVLSRRYSIRISGEIVRYSLYSFSTLMCYIVQKTIRRINRLTK